MTKRSLFTISSILFLLCSGLLFSSVQADAAQQQVKIGVLAYRGAEAALTMWSPTADYLTKNIPHYTFSIVPLSFHEINHAVERGDVDFVLANSSIYVELEARYGADRIATLRNNGWLGGHTVFGGVIFCRADRSDISNLNALKGRSFSAVDETSLGGWQVAWRELKSSGLDPYRDFSSLRFADTHDAVVYAVRDNKADAGTVRTDTLERMAAEGKIDIRVFRILNQQQEKGFPFLLSTRLYPEWPLAVVRHTDSELAEQVAVALITMPHDGPASQAGKIRGWTIPLDYQPVHDLQKELRIGAYRDYGRITPAEVLRLYWHWIALALAALLLMLFLTLHALRLNKRLALAKQLVENARNGLEQEVRERTKELLKAEELSRKYSLDLERLLSISRETTMTTDLKGLYRTFVCASKELLNLDFSTLMLLSEDKKTLTMQDSLGFPEAMIGRFTVVEGQGLTTLVVKSKKPETVADFIGETRFEIPPIVGEKGIRSAVAVPMMMKEDILGVLVGHTVARRDFSQKELDIYQHIANQAAVAIRNAMNTDILRKSEKYIRDVTASLGEGVYVLNAQGETTFMNPEAEALLGWSEKELIHKNIHDVIHNRRADGSTLPFENCEMRKVIETGNRFYSTEERFINKEGRVFPVAVHSRPLMENGKVVASVTAFRDISERKQREQEREKLIADLQKAIAEIKTLHGIVPICASCKKIRDDEGAWHQIEAYISEHTDAEFSHGLCKECAKKLYPEYYKDEKGR